MKGKRATSVSERTHWKKFCRFLLVTRTKSLDYQKLLQCSKDVIASLINIYLLLQESYTNGIRYTGLPLQLICLEVVQVKMVRGAVLTQGEESSLHLGRAWMF